MSQKYDSRIDTFRHIQTVQSLLMRCIQALQGRLLKHDESKLESPEREIFDEYTPKLKRSTYGSDEYKQFLEGMGEALKHHYANNRHHPEHFEDGIRGMNLLDLLEMLVDWKAATLRHDDGDLMRSIEINQERFGYDDDVKTLLINTAKWIEGSGV